MKAYIISLNFHPGHYSHLQAFYKLYSEIGYEPVFYLNSGYSVINNSTVYNTLYSKKSFIRKLEKDDIKLFYSPSFQNIIAIINIYLKFKSHSKNIYYVFHEPIGKVKNYMSRQKNIFFPLWLFLVWFINLIIVWLSSKVLLPSNNALEIYKSRYTKVNPNFYFFPLIFDNEALTLRYNEKMYISYIGTVHVDHAFNEFLSFLKYAIANKRFSNYIFLIATKTDITNFLDSEIENYIKNGKLLVSHKKAMSNEEINDFFYKSIVVWNAYDRKTQSGVLAKSFMFGTPVIAKGDNYVKDGFNGVNIKNNRDLFEIESAIESILNQKENYIMGCLESFSKEFYYRSHIERMDKIISAYLA